MADVMGTLFRQAEHHILTVNSEDIFVEIGTAACAEGSTEYLSCLAARLGTILHTVDIDDRQHLLRRMPNVVGYQARGSEWTQQVLPTLDRTIACLYLDNYDYNYCISDRCEMIVQQEQQYLQKHNINLSNQECVIEHLRQMIDLLPFMSQNSVIICDDTYLYNDCWIGKCGAVVPYLIVNGYQVATTGSVNKDGHGVILTKSNTVVQ